MKKTYFNALFALILALSPALAVAKPKKQDIGPHIWLAAGQANKPTTFADFIKGGTQKSAPQVPVGVKKPKSLAQKAKALPQKAKAAATKAKQKVKVKVTKATKAVKSKPRVTPAAKPTRIIRPMAAALPKGKSPKAPQKPLVSSVVATPVLSVPTHKIEVQKINAADIGLTKVVSRYAKADPKKTFAAVLIYAKDKGKTNILLTRTIHQKIWSPLMGKSIPADTFLTDTAQRVTTALTKGYMPLSTDELMSSSSHDFITTEGTLRVYFVEQSFVPADEITAYTKTKKLFGHDFMWIPVDSLLSSTMNGPFVSLPLGWTFSITSTTPSLFGAPSQLTAQLHPRLFGALRTDAGLAILNAIAKHEKLPARATASTHADSATMPEVLSKVPALELEKKAWDAVEPSDAGSKTPGELNREENAQLASTVAKKGNLLAEIKGRALKVKKGLKPVDSKDKTTQADAEEYRKAIADQRKTLKSSLTSQQKADARQFAAIPLSTTDAYLKFRMGDRFLETLDGDDPEVRRATLKANVYEFLLKYSRGAIKGKANFDLNDTYFETLTDMYEEEVNNKDMVPFYHSTISAMAFIYDLYTEFRNQLTIAAKGKGTLALRGMDDDFMRFMDVNDFYRFFEQGKGKFNYRKVQGLAYPSLGLSTNYSIFGSDGRKKSETYTYFHDGFSRKPADNAWLFNNFAQSLGISSNFDRYSALINRYFENEKRNITLNPILNNPAKRNSDIANNGRMIQIFIHPSVVDQVAHTSLPGGLKMFINNLKTAPAGAYSGARYMVEAMRKDPWYFFTQDLTRAYTPTEPKEAGKYTSEEFQARLLLKPEIFFNPELVKIKTYWRHPIAHEAEYKAKLRSMVREDIQKWLANRIKAKGKVFGAKSGGQGLALQKLYEEVLKGQKVEIAVPVSKPATPAESAIIPDEKSDSYWNLDDSKAKPKDTKKDPNYWYFD